MACFQGKKYGQRNVGFKGDEKLNMPSSIDYITNIAQGFANLNQINYVVYERRLITVGTFYDFEPQRLGRKEYTKLVRFDRKDKGGDLLRDNEVKQPKSTKPEKKKGKRTAAK